MEKAIPASADFTAQQHQILNAWRNLRVLKTMAKRLLADVERLDRAL